MKGLRLQTPEQRAQFALTMRRCRERRAEVLASIAAYYDVPAVRNQRIRYKGRKHFGQLGRILNSATSGFYVMIQLDDGSKVGSPASDRGYRIPGRRRIDHRPRPALPEISDRRGGRSLRSARDRKKHHDDPRRYRYARRSTLACRRSLTQPLRHAKRSGTRTRPRMRNRHRTMRRFRVCFRRCRKASGTTGVSEHPRIQRRRPRSGHRRPARKRHDYLLRTTNDGRARPRRNTQESQRPTRSRRNPN